MNDLTDTERNLIEVRQRLRDTEDALRRAEERLGAEVQRRDAALARVAELEQEVKRLKDRESHYAGVLRVADGGAYRNDWDAAIQRVLRERNDARARIAELEAAVSYHRERRYRNVEVQDTFELRLREEKAARERAEARVAELEARESRILPVLHTAWVLGGIASARALAHEIEHADWPARERLEVEQG